MTISVAHSRVFKTPDDAQRAASDPLSSVWVNASAGSGKTSVLTKRVTRLLLAGVRPEKILCLTYTRAGAAEMANRITAMLGKWAVCDEAELERDLDKLQNAAPTNKQRTEARRLFARVLSCPGGLKIRTIHSFCQEVLSRFPLEAGLPPHFALIDEQETKALRDAVLDGMLQEAENCPSSALSASIAVFIAERGEQGFNDMLHEITGARAAIESAAEQAGGFDGLIAKTREFLELDESESTGAIRADAILLAPDESLKNLAKWWSEGSTRYSDRGKNLAIFLKKSIQERADSFDNYVGILLTGKMEPFSSSFIANKEMLKLHPDITDIYMREAARVLSILERLDAAKIAELTSHAIRIGQEFSRRLAAKKAARAAVDYDDLILLAEALLRRKGAAPWILYKLDQGIDHILVDEAQDTSRAQWSIVQSLTGEFFSGEGTKEAINRSLFVVGDEKQSIFSFQNADPEAFLSLREFFSRRAEAAEKRMEHIGLRTSFRSAPPVLQTVDAIFSDAAVRNGVSQEPIEHTASQNPDGSEKLGRVEVWPLIETDKDNKSSSGEWDMPIEREEDRDPQSELASKIACKIKEWMDGGEALPGYSRPITPGDIMILLRRRGRFADLMVRALKAFSVPVTGVDRMRLVRQLPVMDLLATVRFAILPENDLNLAELLRSPIIGLDEKALMELAMGRRGTLWQSVKDTSSMGAVREYLDGLLNRADFSTPFDFLAHVLNAPCPGDAYSGRKALWKRLGDECLDPIDELINAAQGFGEDHAPSLQNFLAWLTRADAEIKRELDKGSQQGGGQVRIMTAHASKGLEAPIVFLPDTATPPRSLDIPRLQWSENGAPLFLARSPKSGAAKRIWDAARDRQLQEYRRLFYVALTRASSRLYICGWQSRNADNGETSWYSIAKSALGSVQADTAEEEGATAIVIANSPERGAASAAPEQAPVFDTLPEWARKKSDIQRSPSLTPASKEVPAATPDAAFARGRIVHRLLQSLPDVAQEQRKDAARRFLSHPAHGFTQTQRQETEDEVLHLIEDERFAALFASDSMAEVAIAGQLNGAASFRQIDRMCLRGDEVWIVDYKTNRPPPALSKDIPDAYRKQVAEYRELTRGVYPDKKVRCFLLWTYTSNLMEVV